MQNKIVGFLAPKGSGKTYEIARQMREMKRAAVFRVVEKDFAYLGACDELFRGQPRAFAEYIARQEFRCIYQQTAMRMDEETATRQPQLEGEEFAMFVKTCFKRAGLGDGMTMVIDEAHLLLTSTKCPQILGTAVMVGRHEDLDIYYVGQRFSWVYRGLTSNTDEFYFWKTTEPADLDSIRERCGADVAERVRNLRRLEFDPSTNSVTPGEMLHWTAWEGVPNAEKTETEA